MSEPAFILDADPIIPTGIPATAEQVAAMVADPTSPVTEDVIPVLSEPQQPTPEQIADAYAARGEEPVQHEEPS
jgi:hypothetical protein